MIIIMIVIVIVIVIVIIIIIIRHDIKSTVFKTNNSKNLECCPTILLQCGINTKTLMRISNKFYNILDTGLQAECANPCKNKDLLYFLLSRH